METSSIVSFHNEPIKQEYSPNCITKDVNVHELALHVMRDRCLLLQRRINTLENDNMRLKLSSVNSEKCKILESDEPYQMQARLADLVKQKSQLMHHVFMVTCENKNLWNRLACMNNTNKRDITPSTYLLENNTKKQPPLLRSNTYIQNSSPRLDINTEKFSDTSLEEISLKLINSYIQEKSQLVEQYEQMAEMQIVDDVLNLDSIGFAYLEEPGTDSLKEVTMQTEKLMHLKKDLAKQETELMKILSNMEKIFQDGRKCETCAIKASTQVVTENKEIETSDSLAEWATPVQSTSYHENELSEVNTLPQSLTPKDTPQSIILDPADDHDKTCPMCGQIFMIGCTFAQFQQHVENHFIGEPETYSIDYDIETNSGDNNFI